MNHTPGPWQYKPEDDGVYWTDSKSITTSDGSAIVAVGTRGWGEAAALANARLIAAAPDLLEALKALLPDIREMAQPQSVYGYFHGGDPRNFTPDGDSSPEERASHKAACAAYEATGEGSPSCCEHVGNMFITRAPFGLGVNGYVDEDAERHLRTIESAIAKAEGRS